MSTFLKKLLGIKPPPPPTAEEKILQAVAMLNEKQVPEFLARLLTMRYEDHGTVQVRKIDDFKSPPGSPIENKPVHMGVSASINDSKIEFLIAGIREDWEDPRLRNGEAFVFYRGECVLQTIVGESLDMGGGKSWIVNLYAHKGLDGITTSLKVLKVGKWIDDLSEINGEITSFYVMQKKTAEDSRRRSIEKLASEIDLGS